MNREIRAVAAELQRQGWRVERTRRGHLRAVPPQGQMVILPSTPSDRRSLYNAIARLRAQGSIWKGR